MIELIFGGIAYGATLNYCYDGDSCRIHITDAPAIVSNQPIRIHGVDTPEIRGKCSEEKELAILARDHTVAFLSNTSITGHVVKLRDKYGRMVVEFPGLSESLISSNLGRPYKGVSEVRMV